MIPRNSTVLHKFLTFILRLLLIADLISSVLGHV
jgi:hypothetical protein